jgi:hypothetical protein
MKQIAVICTGLALVIIRGPATAKRRAADDRSVYGLQPLEHFAAVETVPSAS